MYSTPLTVCLWRAHTPYVRSPLRSSYCKPCAGKHTNRQRTSKQIVSDFFFLFLLLVLTTIYHIVTSAFRSLLSNVCWRMSNPCSNYYSSVVAARQQVGILYKYSKRGWTLHSHFIWFRNQAIWYDEAAESARHICKCTK